MPEHSSSMFDNYKFRHSPGPFTGSKDSSPASIYAAGDHFTAIAKVYLVEPGTRIRKDPYVANYELFLKAPELLLAVKMALDWISTPAEAGGPEDPPAEIIKALLAALPESR